MDSICKPTDKGGELKRLWSSMCTTHTPGLPLAISFRLEECVFSIADLSRITIPEIPNVYQEGNWYFFNRLFIPKNKRGNGFGKLLMYKVTEWADEKKVNILNEASPYPDSDLSLEQLIAFYNSSGFEVVQENLLVRYCK